MIVVLAVLWWRARHRKVIEALEQAGSLPVPAREAGDLAPVPVFDFDVQVDCSPVVELDEPGDGEPAPPAGWTVPFECEHCHAHNNPRAGRGGEHVELIRWAGERDPRLRWVLRLWCDSCPEPSTRSVSERTASLMRAAFGLDPHDMYAPSVSDNVVAALIEGDWR